MNTPLAQRGAGWSRLLSCAVVAGFCLALSCRVQAQAEGGEGDGPSDEALQAGTPLVSKEDAPRVLALPLPTEPAARYLALQRQLSAALWVGERPRISEALRQLVEAGRGRPDGESWTVRYVNAEYQYGSQGKAVEMAETFLADDKLQLQTRTELSLALTYFLVNGASERFRVERTWSRADGLWTQFEKAGAVPERMRLQRLQVRSEIERLRGNLDGAVATLREAARVGKGWIQAETRRGTPARDQKMLDAAGHYDGTLGMLTYALVRASRPQEAVSLAEGRLAQWRAGTLSDIMGARWNYRLATALVALQRYEPGLAAARTADEMLRAAGSTGASATLWMARKEWVQALIGLRRWQEADSVYRDFIATMPSDVLARTRASDSRLLALLAAKNGRFDEAVTLAEASHRYRLRLYGAKHPQTQEAAGVRGVVRLLRGDVSLAMTDYEELFTATLDNTAGWLDLELRGFRGYVFGIAFDEFMQFVTQRALKGERIDAALVDRAMQIADRQSLGVTQEALNDSTARVLAATPALRELLEQEQAQRQQARSAFTALAATLSQDGALRREMQSDTFKALPEAERKAGDDRLKQVREQIKAQQAATAEAQASLAKVREATASRFPSYADLVTPTTPSPTQLRRLLGAGEAVLVVAARPDATLVWLVGAEGRTAFHAAKVTAAELAQRVAEARRLLDLGSAPAGRAAVSPAVVLHTLYRDLLGPVEPALRGVRSLIVATPGDLASLPFATLVTRAPEAGTAPAWLVRQMAVTQLPTPSALQALRRVASPKPAARALMGFGDPQFQSSQALLSSSAAAAPQALRHLVSASGTRNLSSYDAEIGFRYADMPALPETRDELLALAKALGADAPTDLVLGARATRRAVLEADLSDRRVVAFATHGLMPGELPGVSKPALAMAAAGDESPLLELDDVLGLRLNAQAVLLSACNTAAGEQGGAAMSGLVRGFFFAGTRSVLATHWAVESESAAALSAATFGAQAQGATMSRAEALRQAQLAMIDGPLGAGRWSHPFYWAPYGLFGDPVR